jgi:hypothetical protein
MFLIVNSTFSRQPLIFETIVRTISPTRKEPLFHQIHPIFGNDVPREFFWRRFLPVGLTLTGLKSSSPRARILIYISQVCYCNSMKICGVFTALFPAMVSVGDCAAAVFSFDEKAVREIEFHRAASAIDRLRGRRRLGSAEYRPSLTLPQNYSHCLCYWFKAIYRLRPRPGSMAVA